VQVKATINAANLSSVIEKKRKQLEAARGKVLEDIGKEEVKITQDRIRSSKTGPDGRAWAPWSMATLRQRQREGNVGKGLLYRTGALLTSIAYKVDKGVLHVFTNAPYAKFLQFGTPKMQARPFIGWGSRINNIVARLTEAFK